MENSMTIGDKNQWINWDPGQIGSIFVVCIVKTITDMLSGCRVIPDICYRYQFQAK